MRPDLRWLASALTVTLVLTLLTGCATTFRKPERNLPHAFDTGWRGEKVCEVLYEDERVRVGLCTFPPGIGHERHYHLPHFGYTLESGTMRIEDDEGVREVEIPAAESQHASKPLALLARNRSLRHNEVQIFRSPDRDRAQPTQSRAEARREHPCPSM